jgi:ATP-binding cassette subfamily C (CFTR/MRP) protein 4
MPRSVDLLRQNLPLHRGDSLRHENHNDVGCQNFWPLITIGVSRVWSPEAQSKLISYFSPNQTKLTKNDAIFYACVVIGLKVGHLIVAYNCRIALVEVFLGMKSAVSGLLYRKSLKLTPESLSEVTAGKISTIIIKDLDALEMIVASANELWISLFQTAMTCYLIYCKIGLASFAGILFFLVVLPVQSKCKIA